jgi:hypothetical protein
MIMGINIILTEAQIANLEKKVGKIDLNEFNVSLSCTNMTYQALTSFLDGKEQKKLGNNTIVHMIRNWNTNEVEVAVKYWATDILSINSENVVTLKTNGHTTATTKARLNQFLSCRGAYIYQKNHEWYIKNEFETIEFRDGMQILPDGQFTSSAKIDRDKIPTYMKRMQDLDIDPKFRELYGLSDEEPTQD